MAELSGVSALEALEDILQQEAPGMPCRRGVPMAACTTLRLGGPADLLVEPRTAREVQLVLRRACALQLPVTVMGHGGNLLVKDGGIRGVVLRLHQAMRCIQVEGELLLAEAGAMMPAAAVAAAEHGLAGLTFAGGIPGTVGGGVYMNAGAYGGEMSQVTALVEGFERATGEPFAYTGEEMGFTHRTSRLQAEDKVITRVTFRLTPGDREALKQEILEFNRRRAEKQPLEVPSAGSTFRRPAGHYASALIDQCGLKGCAIGGAQVSEKHAGFLVNRGGTAADFLALMAHVQQVVLAQTGVQLTPEVRILGEDAPCTRV